MSDPPAIKVVDLIVHYGALRVLDGVSLEAPKGKITTIMGRSGCGKTTLLRHLIGLSKATSGTILINDQDITTMSENELGNLRKKMGVLFQGAALFNSMTVADNISLPLREHTFLAEPTIQIMTKIKLELVGLLGFENFMPSKLSGGMKKRAGLARAISMDPEILFFDEPSAGLDPITAAGLDELVLKLKRTFNMTILVVTHELPSVLRIADWVVMMDRGRVLFSGTLDDLKKTEDPTVRQFLERRPEEEGVTSERYLRFIKGEEVEINGLRKG